MSWKSSRCRVLWCAVRALKADQTAVPATKAGQMDPVETVAVAQGAARVATKVTQIPLPRAVKVVTKETLVIHHAVKVATKATQTHHLLARTVTQDQRALATKASLHRVTKVDLVQTIAVLIAQALLLRQVRSMITLAILKATILTRTLQSIRLSASRALTPIPSARLKTTSLLTDAHLTKVKNQPELAELTHLQIAAQSALTMPPVNQLTLVKNHTIVSAVVQPDQARLAQMTTEATTAVITVETRAATHKAMLSNQVTKLLKAVLNLGLTLDR